MGFTEFYKMFSFINFSVLVKKSTLNAVFDV